VRLTELKIYYDMETIFIEKDSYEKIFGPINSFNDFGQKEKKCFEKYLETLKGIQFSYKRLVNKQIEDVVYDCMFEQDMNPSDYKFKSIDLSDPNEFITRIQGVESLCITKLIFTTNLGHKVEIGNDFAPSKNT